MIFNISITGFICHTRDMFSGVSQIISNLIALFIIMEEMVKILIPYHRGKSGIC